MCGLQPAAGGGGGGSPTWYYSAVRLAGATTDLAGASSRLYSSPVVIDQSGNVDKLMIGIGSVSNSCNVYMLVYDNSNALLGAAFFGVTGADANSEKQVDPFGSFAVTAGTYKVAFEESSNNDLNFRYDFTGTSEYMDAAFNSYPNPFISDGSDGRTYVLGLHVTP